MKWLLSRPMVVVGLLCLAVGFYPEISRTVIEVDTIAPDVYAYWPRGTSGTPTSLKMSTTYEISLLVRGERGYNTQCRIDWNVDGTIDEKKNLSFKEMPTTGEYIYAADWVSPSSEMKIKFVFYAEDDFGNPGTATSYGATCIPAGDFYIKDGNDPDWTKATTETYFRANHNDISFKFVATKTPEEITKVWIEIVGVETKYLTKQADGVTWDGWTKTLADGTYTVYGYFYGMGTRYRGLSIVMGANVEPTLPTEIRIHDWLKILGAVLVVLGVIMKR